MHQILKNLSPEQIFLVQGNEQTFSELIKEIHWSEYSKLSRFKMEDAQDLVSFNLGRSGDAWYIVYFDVFVSDAAQALLKTLEEPNEGVHIVFVTPHPYLVPQTIRSRVRLILSDIKMEAPEYISSKKAVAQYIKEVIANEDIDASARRAEATRLLDAFEQSMKDNPEKLEYIYKAKDMLFKANMPTKQVVEYLVAMVF
jgi:DNA polymerase III delta prime subunit